MCTRRWICRLLGVWLLFLGGLAPSVAWAAEDGPPNANASSRAPRVLASYQGGLRLHWEVPALSISPVVDEEGHRTTRVEVPDWFADGAPGTPRLPTSSALLVLPPQGDADIKVNVLRQESRALRVPVQLLPGALADQDRAPQATDVVQLTEIGRMRGIRLARLTFKPFRYDAVQLRLDIVRAVEVTVTFTGDYANVAASTELEEQAGLRAVVLNPDMLKAYAPPRVPIVNSAALDIPGEMVGQFTVTSSGLYALPLSVVAAAWGDSVDPDLVHVLRGTTELALQWEDAAQRFLFYAALQPTRWSTHMVYHVSYGGAAGARTQSRSGDPTGLSVGTAWATAVAEEDLAYQSLYPSPQDGDHWFWDALERSPDPGAPTSRSFPIFLDASPATATRSTKHADTIAPAAELTLWLQGATRAFASPDHRVAVTFNGTALGDVTWDDMRAYTATFDVPATALLDGENAVTLSLPGLPDVSIERVWVDALSLRYAVDRSDMTALRFTGDTTPHAYTLGGFENQPRVYDVTAPDHPIVITDATYENGHISVGDDATGPITYLLTTSSAIQSVATLTTVPTMDEPVGADYLVIAPDVFIPALAPLLAHREGQGLQSFVAPVDAIYARYGDGRVDPEALRAFVAHAYESWNPRPRYLLLVGDGTWDPLDHSANGTPTWVPPYLAMSDPVMGEVPADNFYGMVDGDDHLPDIAVGRLPANTTAEVSTMVNKILTYETAPMPGDWIWQHLFVADDPDGAGDFHEAADTIAAQTPITHTAYKLYCQDYAGEPPESSRCDAPEALRTRLLSRWNGGALVVTWIGHSSFSQWEHGRLFHIDDFPYLVNDRRLPVVLEMTCFTGHFAHPSPLQTAMDEILVRQADTGAMAVWGSSGEGYRQHHTPLAVAFYETAFAGEPMRLGDITSVAKAALAGGAGAYLVDTYHLLGDPALTLNRTYQPWSDLLYLPLTLQTG